MLNTVMSSSVVERQPSQPSASSPGAPAAKRTFPKTGFPSLAKIDDESTRVPTVTAATAAPSSARVREEEVRVAERCREYLGEEVAAMSKEQLQDAVSSISDFYSPETLKFLLGRVKKLSLHTADGTAVREAPPSPPAPSSSSTSYKSSNKATRLHELGQVTAEDYIATTEEEMQARIRASDKATQRNLEWAVGSIGGPDMDCGEPQPAAGDDKKKVTNAILQRMRSDRFDLDGNRVFVSTAGLEAAILSDLRGNSLLARAEEQPLAELARRCVQRLRSAGAITVVEGDAPRELLNHQLDPHSPGYSFSEISEMFRSGVPTQRLVAFRILSGVLAHRDAVVAAEGYEYTCALPALARRGVHGAYVTAVEELLLLLPDSDRGDYLMRKGVRRVLTFALQNAVSADLPPELPTLLVWGFGFKSYSAPAVKLATLQALRDFLRCEMEELAAERLWEGRLGLAELPRLGTAHSRRDESSYEEFSFHSEQKRRNFLGEEVPEGRQEMSAQECFSYGCRWGRVDSVLQESDVLPRLGDAVLGGVRAGDAQSLLCALCAMESIALALRTGDGSTLALVRALVRGKLWAMFFAIETGYAVTAGAASGTAQLLVQSWWRVLAELGRRDGASLQWMRGQPAFEAALCTSVAEGRTWSVRLARLVLSRGGGAGLGLLGPLLQLLRGAPAAELRPELLDFCEAAVDALGATVSRGGVIPAEHLVAARAVLDYCCAAAKALAVAAADTASSSLTAAANLTATLLGSGDGGQLVLPAEDFPRHAVHALRLWWPACGRDRGFRSEYEQGELEVALLRLALCCQYLDGAPLPVASSDLAAREYADRLASAPRACNSVAEGLVAWRLSRSRCLASLLRLHLLRRLRSAGAVPLQQWLRSLLCCASHLGQGMLPSLYSVVVEIVSCLQVLEGGGAAVEPPAVGLVLQLLDVGSVQGEEFVAHPLQELESETLLLRSHCEDDGSFLAERYCGSLPLRRDWPYESLGRLSGEQLLAWLRCLHCWEGTACAPSCGQGAKLYCLLRLAKPSSAPRWFLPPSSDSEPLQGLPAAFCSLALCVVGGIGDKRGWAEGAGACAEELAAASAAEAYSSAKELSQRGLSADGVSKLCEELLQGCALQEICPEVHSLVLALMVSPLVPLRAQRRTWAELGSARLLHLFEGEHFEGPLRLQPLFLLSAGANALQLQEARLVVRALSSLRAQEDCAFAICGVAVRLLSTCIFDLWACGEGWAEADRGELLCEMVEDNAVPAWVLAGVLAFAGRCRRDLQAPLAAAAASPQPGDWAALASALESGAGACDGGAVQYVDARDRALLSAVWSRLERSGASKLPLVADVLAV